MSNNKTTIRECINSPVIVPERQLKQAKKSLAKLNRKIKVKNPKDTWHDKYLKIKEALLKYIENLKTLVK